MKDSLEIEMKTGLWFQSSKRVSESINRDEVPAKITLDFMTNLAMREDDDAELGKEVRRILGVEPSRRPEIKDTLDYLPASSKL